MNWKVNACVSPYVHKCSILLTVRCIVSDADGDDVAGRELFTFIQPLHKTDSHCLPCARNYVLKDVLNHSENKYSRDKIKVSNRNSQRY